MALPYTLANGVGNLPDATQLMANFNYLQGLASANILINGGFDFFQRGTSLVNPAANTYLADRWKFRNGGTLPTFTVSQELSIVDAGSTNAMKILVTGNTANTGTDFTQAVENYIEYGGKTITFQLRVRATVTGAKIWIYDGTTTTYSAVLATTGAYTTMTVTATLQAVPGALMFGFDTNVGAQIPIGTWYLDNASAVIGSQGVPYIPRPVAQELALCQRYYQKSFAQGTTPGHNIAANFLWLPTCTGGVAGNTYFGLPYKVEMRVAPTVYLFDPMATGSVNAVHIYRTGAGTQMTSFAMLGSTIGITGNCTGGNAGYADDMIAAHYAADAEM